MAQKLPFLLLDPRSGPVVDVVSLYVDFDSNGPRQVMTLGTRCVALCYGMAR
jgi:hypothetical protein